MNSNMEEAPNVLTKRRVNGAESRDTTQDGTKSAETVTEKSKKKCVKLSKDNPARQFDPWMKEMAPMWKFSRTGKHPVMEKRELPIWKRLAEKNYERLYLFGNKPIDCLASFPDRDKPTELTDGKTTVVIKCSQQKDVHKQESCKYFRLSITVSEEGKDDLKQKIEVIHWSWPRERVPDSKSMIFAFYKSALGKKSLFLNEPTGTQSWALQLLFVLHFMTEKQIKVSFQECYRFLLSLRGQTDEKKILLFHVLYLHYTYLVYAGQYMHSPRMEEWFKEYAEVKKQAYEKKPGDNTTIVTTNLPQFKPPSSSNRED